MNRLVLTAGIGTTVLVAALSSAASATAGPTSPTAVSRHAEQVCSAAPVGYAACAAQVVVNSAGKPLVAAAPSGYGPADIQSAYALSSICGRRRHRRHRRRLQRPHRRRGSGRLPVDLRPARLQHRQRLPAHREPERWLQPAHHRRRLGDRDQSRPGHGVLGLPGLQHPPGRGNSASFANLGAAVNYAASQGVAAISNSYGGGDTGASSDYDHPGIAVTASTGDSGYGIESPASYDSVVAVGGTSLSPSGNARGWSEQAWSGAGSGCSSLNAKPSWQTSATQCSGKAVADVSAVADPQTGVAVYDTTPYQGSSGWQVYGGTSASSPIIASVYAMSGNTSGYPASYTWGTHIGPERRHLRVQRELLAVGLVQRRSRMGRPDGSRHAQRHQQLLS